jgi:hypothetical protein
MRHINSWTKYLVLVATTGLSLGITNVDPISKFSWSENAGWLNWRDANGGADGVMIGSQYLSGFIWGENIGWINVGDGTPGGGGGYANVDGSDAGVNIAPDGNLSGLAWGENVGWINFGTTPHIGADGARFDPVVGRFRGWAWGENIGWVNLDDATAYVARTLSSGPTLVSAVSRRTHGGVGDFDVNLPLAPPALPAVEGRSGGPTRLIFTFSALIKALDGTPSANEVSVSAGTVGSVSINGHTLTANLSGVPDQTCLTVVLNGLGDLSNHPLVGDNDVRIRVLVGDANGDGQVASGDITQVKSVSGQVTNSTNFRRDINADGQVASGDITQVKSRSGRSVICP